MGIACSCLKAGKQVNSHHDSHFIDGRLVRGYEPEGPQWKEPSSIMKENGETEQDSPRNACNEIERMGENRSTSMNNSTHGSTDNDEAGEKNELKSSRRMAGGANGMRRPRWLLFQNSSPTSSPIDGGKSSHSPASPQSRSPTISPLSSASRKSTEVVRQFAERISKRILSLGREAEDGMEIAWFIERESDKDDVMNREVEGNDGDIVIEVIKGEASGVGEVESNRNGKARWRVVITERPCDEEVTCAAECGEDEEDEKVEREEKDSETNDMVREGTECYEEVEELRQMDDTIVILSEESEEEVWKVSSEIARKAIKYGGIREDSKVIIV